MTIYMDSDFKCYTEDGEGRTAVETNAFDGKCAAYIEGMRFVPAGQVWTRDDGEPFGGQMVTPWQDFAALERAQSAWDKQQYEAAIDELILLI